MVGNARPELIVALTSALGTDLSPVVSELSVQLQSVGYEVRETHVSSLLESYSATASVPFADGDSRYETLMNQGDAVRQCLDDGSAAAKLVVADLKRARAEAAQRLPAGESLSRGEWTGQVTIVRQLKHPREVELMRDVYGSRFLLFACWANERDRLEAVTRMVQDRVPNQTEPWYAEHALALIKRDEQDKSSPFGQRVQETFELADAYVVIRKGESPAPQLGRLIRAFFGDPFLTPTTDEQAMYFAHGARLRSSAGGRQVGAAVVDGDGEVLVTGTNDVPRAGGGQYWSDHSADHRDFMLGYDYNDREKHQIVVDLLDRLQRADLWLDPRFKNMSPVEIADEALAPGGPMKASRIADLLEFGRILHAEMAAICTAARRGTALAGTTLYTTTYPCHECARLIIGAGIARVVYIDPYPKSLVPEMFADQASERPGGPDKVRLVAFAGVSPRVFAEVFEMSGRGRDRKTGRYDGWDLASATLKLMSHRDRDPYFLASEDVTLEDFPTG